MATTDRVGRKVTALVLGAATAALAAPVAEATVVQGSADQLLGRPNPAPTVLRGVIEGDRNGLRARVTGSAGPNTNVRIYDALVAPGLTLSLTSPSETRNVITYFESELADDPSFASQSKTIAAVPNHRYIAAFKEQGTTSSSTYLYQCDFDGLWNVCK